MGKLRVLSLFAGIGGIDLGLERTGGFETVAFCEIDPFCRRVLKKHWPNVRQYEDVRELNADTLAGDGIAADFICGGFPCQNVSNAGYAWGVRKGLEGEQSGLWREYARLVDEVGPIGFIIENVRALLSDGLATVLQDISALGYDAEWHCIPASHVGAPQNRDRVWITAYARQDREQGLLQGSDIGASGSGWACRQEDLPRVFSDPFGGHRWPQPIIRGGDNRPANWVDRIGACGNAVVPQIPEAIGHAFLQSLRGAA